MRGGLTNTNVFNDMPKKPPSKQQLYILQDSVIPVAVQYNTDKTLSDLSQRISLGIKKDRNGDEINPTVPPKYITYEMLYNECIGDVQVPRITKEEKDTLKATFIKKTEYSHYNKSIGAKILLNDKLYELERVKWWCDWYKIMKGTKQRKQPKRTKRTIRAKTLGGAGARSYSPGSTRQERREYKEESRIQKLYRTLIPIRNVLLFMMRSAGRVAYTAADVIYWTVNTVKYITKDDIDEINAANEETMRQENARTEDFLRRQRQARSEDFLRRQREEDIQRQRQEQWERTRREPEYYEKKFAETKQRVRGKNRDESVKRDENIRQNRFDAELKDLQDRVNQARAAEAAEEARRREIEIEIAEIHYIMKILGYPLKPFNDFYYNLAREERLRRKSAGQQIPWDTAPQSPPRAATRAVHTPAPAPVAQPFVATQDDSNLGSLETWDAISKTKIRWDNISGIHSLLGSNNNNTVASVMLFLYLRNNKNIQLLGNETIDTLTARFIRDVFNTNPSIRPIGDEFFKIKDSQSKVYSISRMTLLRQRLNRIFFFLARDREDTSYTGYKRSRGDGYNFANYIGITDQDFEVIIKNKADYTKSVSLGAGNAVSMFSGEAPSEQTVNVVIPITLYKIYRKVLLKSHPDKGGSDGEIKRSQLMFENFLKWIKSYNPTKTENETHFYNVEHLEVKWDKYNEGKWDKYNEDNDFTMKWFLD